jgi:hypothetical protein
VRRVLRGRDRMACSRGSEHGSGREDGDTSTEERSTGGRTLAAIAVLLSVVLFGAGCSSSANDATSGDSSSAATSHVAVTLDDHGLHAAPASTTAGIIAFSLADRRTKPTGSEVLLYYEVQPNLGGDLITGVGGNVRVLMCPHTWYLVVRIDGAVKGRVAFPITGTSPDCTTPIT